MGVVSPTQEEDALSRRIRYVTVIDGVLLDNKVITSTNRVIPTRPINVTQSVLHQEGGSIRVVDRIMIK